MFQDVSRFCFPNYSSSICVVFSTVSIYRTHKMFQDVFLWGYCVLASILNPNCNFTSIFFHFVVLPLLFQNEGSLRKQQVTVLKKLKDDRFALPNIAFLLIFQTPIVILPPLYFTLCFYPYFSKTKASFTPILNSVIYIWIKTIKINKSPVKRQTYPLSLDRLYQGRLSQR